jgi:uncharacterized protein YndB with AHSA1/START domain
LKLRRAAGTVAIAKTGCLEAEEEMGDYHLQMQFDIAADPATVTRALETQEGVASWWTTHATLDEGGEGRRLRTSFPDTPQPFEFAVRETPERVEWVTGSFPPWWAGTTVRFDIGPNPDGPGTRLLFSHRDYEPDNPVIPIVTPAWAQILLRLKGYAETGTRQPFFDF